MSSRSVQPRRVLITGSSGAIGLPIAQHLRQRGHFVRGLDRKPTADADEMILGDISERAKVQDAVVGIDTVIHLAATVDDADFIESLIEPNVRGLFHVCDAAREQKVQRLVLASSVQAITGHRLAGNPELIRIEDGPKPVNHYALTKVWGEQMGEMYARHFGMSVINVRIGWYPRTIADCKRLDAFQPWGSKVYFSHDDAKRFFERCVESETPNAGECLTTFAASNPIGDPKIDLSPARQHLGYEPQDVWPHGIPFESREWREGE